jgi:hypothetical protein
MPTTPPGATAAARPSQSPGHRARKLLVGLLAVALAFVVSGLAGPDAHAKKKKKDGEGTPVTVRVLDIEGAPVPTAVIRHPDEADRRRVNAVTGEWTGSVLYLPDGSEMIFTPGITLTLEISAPGYMTQIIQYDVRKRGNKVEITLPQLDLDDVDVEEPLIQFGRDKPRDVGGSGPAN